jgi:transcriptional regulator with XRE-family HTH domain
MQLLFKNKFKILNMSEISERLQDLLNKKRYIPAHLAKESGVDESVISRILKHNCIPQRKNLNKLANFLQIDPEWLRRGVILEEVLEEHKPSLNYLSPASFVLDGVEYKRLTDAEKVDVLLAQNNRLMGMLEKQISSVNILVKNIDSGATIKNE